MVSSDYVLVRERKGRRFSGFERWLKSDCLVILSGKGDGGEVDFRRRWV